MYIIHVVVCCMQYLTVSILIDDSLEQRVSGLGSISHNVSSSQEPNLNDVIDYLSNDDPGVVIKAASYLQHLAFNDDSNKAKIRYVLA